MTREIAVEYARQGIRANSLCPGPIATPMLEELMSDPARRQRRLVHIPMGRLGQAEELANGGAVPRVGRVVVHDRRAARRRRRDHRGVHDPGVS